MSDNGMFNDSSFGPGPSIHDRQRGERRTRVFLAFVAITTVLIAVGGFVALRHNSKPKAVVIIPTPSSTTPSSTAVSRTAPSSSTAVVTAAGAHCTADEVVTPGADWTTHISGRHDYEAAPPAGGPHSSRTLPMGSDHFYSREDNPAPERAVHDMEHGLVIAWYDAALPDAAVAALQQYAADAGELRMVAVPWDRGEFADGRHFVLTAWGVTKRCAGVSADVIRAFVDAHADAPGLQERTFPV